MSHRKTIGVQIDHLEGGFSDGVWTELRRSIESLGYRFVLIAGKMLRSTIPLDYQFNRMYNFICPQTVDGLIVTFGLDFFTSTDELRSIIKEFGNIPIVSLSDLLEEIPSVTIDNKKAVQKVAEHLYRVHNRKKIAFISGPLGSLEAAERKKGYVEFFQQIDQEYNPHMVVEGGDFLAYSGTAAVVELLDKGMEFDGLICSSDAQAVGAHEELTRRGYRIPQDVSLFGFDDVRDLECNRIGLSSIHQPIRENCDLAVRLLDRMMKGETVEMRTKNPLRFALRSSCGCFSENLLDLDYLENRDDTESRGFPREKLLSFFRNPQKAEPFVKILEERIRFLTAECENFEEESSALLARLNQIMDSEELALWGERDWHPFITLVLDWVYQMHLGDHCFRQMNLFFQKLRIIVSDKQNFLETRRTEDFIHHSEIIRILSQRFIFTSDFLQVEYALKETLNHLGIHSFHLFLFEGDLSKPREFYLPLQKYARPVISIFRDAHKLPPRRRIRTDQLMSDTMRQDGSGSFILLPLFQSEELLGYMLIEPGPEQGAFYQNLLYLLSSVLKSVILFQSQQDYQKRLKKTLKELEKTNRKLQEQNREDPHTGLYNRRGFYLLAENNLQLIRRMKKKGLLFYGDMDGLKIINDTWGHKAGDEAIAAVAWALRNTFRSSDILARFGGDEFVIMTIDIDESSLEDIFSRLQKNLNMKTRQGRGYSLDISMGYMLIEESNAHLNLDELLHEADTRLYDEKQRRKKNRKR